MKIRKEEALKYHAQGKPGKVEVVPTKPLSSQYDLALAYSPGVAEPCLEIADTPEAVYKYTAKGNLVAVISNGTAVLGLGNIGPEASKPVMEGKGVLFKKFAGIDVFDIEINCEDPEEFIRIVKSLEPTFGGINLEDIKAPESFIIEEALREQMSIPVMHDDQHGTAIISAAGLLNALDLVDKKIEEIQVVVNGAGASALACADLYLSLGVKRENLVMLDSKGVVKEGRAGVNRFKQRFASQRNIDTLEEAIEGADMFLGLSKANVLEPEMLLRMAERPIVFALANPNPEIEYNLAMSTRDDIIMATGRSDHPNQVNNVLGFPYIFRGALDVRATSINEEMKLAAVYALAKLAKEPVPEIVTQAYGESVISFGPKYFIPKPMDPRLMYTVSSAVAQAAMSSGVAQNHIQDWDAYQIQLQERLGIDTRLMSKTFQIAQRNPKKVLFAEADNLKILKAAQALIDEGIAQPILLGKKDLIKSLIEQNNLDLSTCQIIDQMHDVDRRERFGDLYYAKRQRKGVTHSDALKRMSDRTHFGLMMLETGETDIFVSGLTKHYPSVVRPALEIIGTQAGSDIVAGMYVVMHRNETLFFADTTVNDDPSLEELVSIIGLTRKSVKSFGITPRMAVLSYSNFGSARGKVPQLASEAVRKAKELYPDLLIDGELQANIALNPELLTEKFPFSDLAHQGANTLIFPNLSSGNIAYKLVQEFGVAETIGPVLLGMKKPVHILALGSSVREIVNMVAIAVVDAQTM